MKTYEAKLIQRGAKFDIYVLYVGDKCEVLDFLERKVRERPQPAHLSGLRKNIDLVAKNGYKVPEERFKCWKQVCKEEGDKKASSKNYHFCEFIKDKWRISAFSHGKKLLLVTYFRKNTWRENKQYCRAVKLDTKFKENPKWSV